MPLSDQEILTQLQRTRDSLIQRRLEVLQAPKPSYNIDGQDVKWGEYLKQLNESLAEVEKSIKQYDGPFEFETVGYV